MRHFKLFLAGFLLIPFISFGVENDGEDLDLTAVLNLFESSKTVEEFENKLNSEKEGVNNLDLNKDGQVDYIRVIDYQEGDHHSLTLQVPFTNDEAQDVAVILLEKEEDGSVITQIVGDEDLYGPNYIIEPGNERETSVTKVQNWIIVKHIYSPKYRPWISPWRFSNHPHWYKPWKPVPRSRYIATRRSHRVVCRRVTVFRAPRAHQHYMKKRKRRTIHNHTHPHPHPHKNKGTKPHPKKKPGSKHGHKHP